MENYSLALRKERALSYNVVLLNLFVSFLMLTPFAAAINRNTSGNFRIISDSSGRSLCPVDSSSVSFSSDQLAIAFPGSGKHPPGEILCAWKCAKDVNCTSFNWKSGSGRCELYYYTPTNCSYSCGCLHFEVGATHTDLIKIISCSINYV